MHLPTAAIPTLAGTRLTLRAPRMEDWSAYCAFMATDRSIYMGGPHQEAIAWGMFCHDVAQWHLLGHGSLMIEAGEGEAAAGQCIGQVGINAGPLFPEHELGWMLYDGFEGKGYAFEAASRMRHWAFRTLKLETLVSYIHPENAASCRLAERLGAVLDKDAARHDPADLVYRHARP
ncbi:RimJ/RimL family protein N-acetyltransferase [Neorhizobium huautlense]|uniref:RimJ/RimL family protein N-acetyltransferase n=1 Tax=Neorhizobium huautlense TaxID=67774 RepID=A0ABT9PNZ0_9HYPH|nr:GNAT family N-acetyltransferase [Neorhizobium huautlense]MDP9836191.1 RimJ/RimL family protein N-acetyltransferase [Neorhizobium huautlense]